HLYEPTTAVRSRLEPTHGRSGRRFVGQNPPPGAQIYYSLTAKAGKVNLKVVDYAGKTVRELAARTEPGLHRAAWGLSLPPTRGAGAAAGAGGAGQRRGGGGGGAGARGAGAGGGAGAGTVETPGEGEGTGGRRGFGAPVGPPAPPGMYRVVLNVDGQEF